MPCLIALIALAAPRIVLIVLYLATHYLSDAYRTALWPVLGFFFLPLTTLAYAWAWHYGHGSIQGLGLAVVVIAVLMDLGTHGGSGASRRKKRMIVRVQR
jgi:hypothetical protein